MIKINKWFDDDAIQNFKNDVVAKVINKTRVKYGGDDITYIKFGTKVYSINVEELLTYKLKDLRAKYKGLDIYMYLCRLTKYKGKSKKDFLIDLYRWDPTIKKVNNNYIIHLEGNDITIDPVGRTLKEFQNIRKYVIEKINDLDSDIYSFLLRNQPYYYKNNSSFEKILELIEQSLSQCLFENGIVKAPSIKYDKQPYIIHYKIISMELRDKLLTSLGISTCPYCNRQYITIWHDEESDKNHSTADLDHFYIKSEYPLFALSLFNFIPSCQICNSRFKGAKVRNTLYPFEDEFGSKTQFQLELNGDTPNEELQIHKWLGAVNSSSDDLKLSLTPIDESHRDDFGLKVQGSKELFRLDEVYDCHKSKAVDVVMKKRIYLEGTYQGFMNDILEKENIKNISLEKFILGYDWDNGNFDEPLSKMTYDIFNSTK